MPCILAPLEANYDDETQSRRTTAGQVAAKLLLARVAPLVYLITQAMVASRRRNSSAGRAHHS
jgi:hypothetical protein